MDQVHPAAGFSTNHLAKPGKIMAEAKHKCEMRKGFTVIACSKSRLVFLSNLFSLQVIVNCRVLLRQNQSLLLRSAEYTLKKKTVNLI